MKKKRYTEDQIVTFIREAERTSIAEVARHRAVAEQTLYRWRKAYGDMDKNKVQDYRRLQQENARLKKLVAERDLEIEAMKEVTVKKW